MSNIALIALITYSWVSWIGVGILWASFVIRCTCMYIIGTLFSRKTLQNAIIPAIITVFAVFPPYTLSLAMLYGIIAIFIVLYYRDFGGFHGNHH